MLSTYQYPKFEYQRPPELDGVGGKARVVVVGAGPVGISMAIDLAQQGISVLLLDDDETVSVGSRGLCYAKRTLEILDRYGAGQPVVDKGVSWNVGRTFYREEEVYHFNLLPVSGHERPGMINLQQYYLEEYLLKRANELPEIEIRWKNKVTHVDVDTTVNKVSLSVETPEGVYELECDWVVAADGARSGIRRQLGLDIEGKIFQDRFLIADVVMKADFPAERWFWFDPPFHRNQSVLLHREADNVWRIDFQLGWDADPEEEKKPENVIPRIKAMLGDEREFELEWVSVYTFQCRRMKNFRHKRVLFVGDAAHQVSPFGARGANSGIQDVDNLGWKLRLVLEGKSPESLLDTYHEERAYAADENIMNSTRSTDFITPKSNVSKQFRDSVLRLAKTCAFARSLVNSGRLSVPSYLYQSSLNGPSVGAFEGGMIPGAPMEDAPVLVGDEKSWLLRHINHSEFAILFFANKNTDLSILDRLSEIEVKGIRLLPVCVISGQDNVDVPSRYKTMIDSEGLIAQRYDAQPGTLYLLRPDQHVVARWREVDADEVKQALSIATANHYSI